jgi:hypothetical protein
LTITKRRSLHIVGFRQKRRNERRSNDEALKNEIFFVHNAVAINVEEFLA